TLKLPGLVALDYAPDGAHSKIYLRVEAGDDVSIPYTLDARLRKFSCGADKFDMYGDTDPNTAPVVPSNDIFELRACTGDQDWLRLSPVAGDQLTINATFERGSMLGLEALDARGRTLTSTKAIKEAKTATIT